MTPYSYRDDPSVPSFDDHAPVAVMDGECGICSRGARLIHRLDQSGEMRICPIQSPLGRALAAYYGIDADAPSSWLFLEKGRAYCDVDAIMRVGQVLGGWGRLATVFAVLPKPMRRWLYHKIARRRYRLFGRADLCAFPDPAFQKRLLR
ncbi:thiol-disulfide oxidoreductase DCC family protein [Paracoccaceae bacterium GXU_MW_L88]